VINQNFTFWSIMFFITYIYIEIFLNIIFVAIFKNTKNYFINYTKKDIKQINEKKIFSVYYYFIILYILSLKVVFFNNYIYSVIVFYAVIAKFINKNVDHNLDFLMFNILILLLAFNYIENILIFFLFIEMYSIIFYFFFISADQTSMTNALQHKNMLLLYLLNNFFSTVTFLLGIYYMIVYYGTLSFSELGYLPKIPHWEIYFLIISFIIKLSLPGFHFLKIEIYKYLPFNIVIVYSVVTLFLNFVFISFFFNQSIIYINIVEFRLFNLLIIMGLLIFIQKLKLNNFHEFLAYSGFSTTILVTINYII